MRYFELSWKLIFWCIHHSVMHLISITLAEETRSAFQTCNPESLTLGQVTPLRCYPFACFCLSDRMTTASHSPILLMK